MTTEFILLLVVTVVMLMTPVYKGVRGVFEYGGPSIAIRMEKHLVTGYLFSKKAENYPDEVSWQ